MESLAPLLGGGRGKPVSFKQKEKFGNLAKMVLRHRAQRQPGNFLMLSTQIKTDPSGCEYATLPTFNTVVAIKTKKIGSRSAMIIPYPST
jgi:hypothetical protein